MVQVWTASEDRTEAATPRRLLRAREQGSSPVSREVATLAGMAAATLVLAMAGPSLGRSITVRLSALLAPGLDLPGALIAALKAAAMASAPVMLAVAAAIAASALLQTGFQIRPAALLPDLTRLNPAHGLKRLFGMNTLIEAGKSVIKLAVLGWVAVHVISAGLPKLRSAMAWRPDRLADEISQDFTQLMLSLLAAQTVIAGADFVWQRFRHARDLRMSKQDLRDETKEADGNPLIKQRLRQLRTARSRRRMMAAVPGATVVLTNPTHYAVALTYDRVKGGAPRVVAKGVDEVAARIRDLAKQSRVPIVANPPLARSLYLVELDTEIPAEHFKLVAEIIAYVWRLRAKRSR